MQQVPILTDLDRILRSPGGAYITIVGLVFLCLFLFFILGPICERLVRAVGLEAAPSLKAPKQEARGETARTRGGRAGQDSANSTLFLIAPIGPVGIRRGAR